MNNIPVDSTQRVEAAVRQLRSLVGDVEDALVCLWKDEWPDKLREKLRVGNQTPISLHDSRILLKTIAEHSGKGGQVHAPIIPLAGIDPRQAAVLLEIQNAIKHETGARWHDGDDLRAERIVASFMAGTRKRSERTFASVLEHHQEVFELRDGKVWHRWWPAVKSDPESPWSDWHHMDSDHASSIASVSGQHRLDIFILVAGLIQQRTWTLDPMDDRPVRLRSGSWSKQWSGRRSYAQHVTGPIDAVSHHPDHLELFAFGERGQQVHRWSWGGNEWTPWMDF